MGAVECEIPRLRAVEGQLTALASPARVLLSKMERNQLRGMTQIGRISLIPGKNLKVVTTAAATGRERVLRLARAKDAS